MNLKIKKLHSNAVMPEYSREGDVGLDLTAHSVRYDLETDTHIYGFGLAVEIPQGHFGLIFPRSSIFKMDQSLTNAVGVIDENYRGELKAVFRDSRSSHCVRYDVGQRIAQLVILPYPKVEIQEVDELSDTNRGSAGFGSSGA